eukprot:TRINITY_DN14652_c0_g1_i1.p4 TRINITY_DN14652_c0_g1~~TRINITY_DN14652_c0_g1_i1.p4  ORF type:complete len:50 (+),score=14.75 TRINITY_DN14652_c0_g1_i1:280-429(+)
MVSAYGENFGAVFEAQSDEQIENLGKTEQLIRTIWRAQEDDEAIKEIEK